MKMNWIPMMGIIVSGGSEEENLTRLHLYEEHYKGQEHIIH